VTIIGKKEEVELIPSMVEKQARRSQESRHEGSFEPQHVPADDSRQRASTGHLNVYYDAVIARIRGAESILIFGPGEAKDELKKRLKKINPGGCIVCVETIDKMTDHQVVAKVRKHFEEKSPSLA
jgi:hypothetical protein